MPRPPGPLFSTPADRVLAACPAQSIEFVQSYLNESPLSKEELATQVRDYLVELESLSETEEFLDITTARHIASQCHALIRGLTRDSSTHAHQLVHAAVRYFIEDDDAEGDSSSPIGFDDDAEVVEIIARELGREDVLQVSGIDN